MSTVKLGKAYRFKKGAGATRSAYGPGTFFGVFCPWLFCLNYKYIAPVESKKQTSARHKLTSRENN